MKKDNSLILRDIKLYYRLKTDAEFARFLGIKPNSLANWYSRNTMDYEKVISKCEDIDANWLLTGKGTMLKSNATQNVSSDFSFSDPSLNSFTNIIGELSVITGSIFQHNQIIPKYDINSITTLELFFNNNIQKPVDYYSIPNLPKVDGAFSIIGDSMFPILKSGDIIFYSQINDFKDNLCWGGMYLLDLNTDDGEYMTVHYIHSSDKGEDWIKLVSSNTHYSPQEIHVSTVRSAAFIKGFLQICNPVI